jgi:molecular chaperone Hsp33
MKRKPPNGGRPADFDDGHDILHTFIMADDTIRGAVIDGSRMVNQMRWNHGLGILETLVLGHAYLGAGLMSATLKGRDRLRLQVDCSGPIKGFVVEANAAGDIRGFLKNVPIPIDKPLESFNLSPFFGAGFLSVTRMLEGAKQPFTGQVMLAHGNLATDLVHYYLTSEQIPTAFSLSVKFDHQGVAAGAGGLVLQAMPDADDALVLQIEDRVVALPSIGMVLSDGETARNLVETHLTDFSPRFLSQRSIDFNCHCNRDQIRNLLIMMPLDELKDIQANGPFPVEIRCHHCSTAYRFNREQIDRIVATRFSD